MVNHPDARKPDKPLKRGWTTGACATAAVTAAYQALLTGEFRDIIRPGLGRAHLAPRRRQMRQQPQGHHRFAAAGRRRGDDKA